MRIKRLIPIKKEDRDLLVFIQGLEASPATVNKIDRESKPSRISAACDKGVRSWYQGRIYKHIACTSLRCSCSCHKRGAK